eukprot:Tbor_TRINITY_DN1804_c0_g1::TRINITY_DN1804_c0_g1_i1::g.23103::m.23103
MLKGKGYVVEGEDDGSDSEASHQHRSAHRSQNRRSKLRHINSNRKNDNEITEASESNAVSSNYQHRLKPILSIEDAIKCLSTEIATRTPTPPLNTSQGINIASEKAAKYIDSLKSERLGLLCTSPFVTNTIGSSFYCNHEERKMYNCVNRSCFLLGSHLANCIENNVAKRLVTITENHAAGIAQSRRDMQSVKTQCNALSSIIQGIDMTFLL